MHDDITRYAGGRRDCARHRRAQRRDPSGLAKGRHGAGFREADLVLEHTFRIPSRHEGYLEPHGCLVAIDDRRPHPGVERQQGALPRPHAARPRRSACRRSDIRVNVVHVGGDFGGKGDAVDLPIAYFLARQAGRPVKLLMSYAEELIGQQPEPSDRDHDSVRRHPRRPPRRAVRADRPCQRRLRGAEAQCRLSTWHYVGGCYRVPHAAFEFLQIATNTVPGGYFRAPGCPPVHLRPGVPHRPARRGARHGAGRSSACRT